MKHLKPWAITATALLGALLAPGSQALAYCRAELAPRIDAIAQRSALQKARLGVLMETQAGQVVYSRDADRYFVPASNVKLLTTAAALSSLGPNFTLRTSIYGSTEDRPTLQVVGRGDPTFGDPQLTELARQLKAQNISTVAT